MSFKFALCRSFEHRVISIRLVNVLNSRVNLKKKKDINFKLIDLKENKDIQIV